MSEQADRGPDDGSLLRVLDLMADWQRDFDPSDEVSMGNVLDDLAAAIEGVQ